MYSALLGDYSWKILDFEPNFGLTRAELIDLCGLCRVVARRAARYWMNMRIATDAVPGLGCCAVRWIDRLSKCCGVGGMVLLRVPPLPF